MKQITDWTRDRLSKSFSSSVRKNSSSAVSARDAQETKPQHKIMAFCVYFSFPRTGGSVGLVSGCHAGGREFDSGWTNTQGLKITEEKVLPL